MGRTERFREAIEAWDWDAIKREALDNPETDENGDTVGTAYLGSVLFLTPSGKIYAPFACSNVMGCNGCGGTGVIRRKEGNAYRHNKAKQALVTLYRDGKRNGWGTNIGARMLAQATASRYAPIGTCPVCFGYGSREAAEDEMWREELERVAARHGMFITSNDDDGILAGIFCDPEDSADEE
jgi:hypothetical protein